MGRGKGPKVLYLCSVALCNYVGGKFSVEPRFYLPHCTPSHAELLQTPSSPGRTNWLLQRSMIPFLKKGELEGNPPDCLGNILKARTSGCWGCGPHSIPTQRELGRDNMHTCHTQAHTYPGQKAGEDSIKILAMVLWVIGNTGSILFFSLYLHSLPTRMYNTQVFNYERMILVPSTLCICRALNMTYKHPQI